MNERHAPRTDAPTRLPHAAHLLAVAGAVGCVVAGTGRRDGTLLPHMERIVLETYPVLFRVGVPVVSGTYDHRSFSRFDLHRFGSGAVVTTYERPQPDATVRRAVP